MTTMMLDPMWWSVLFGSVCALSLVALGIRIMGQTSKKMAITRRAQDQISEGAFEPVSMMKYCTDPCWRVVVSEVLKEANVPTKKRRALIKEFSKEAVEASKMLILVNRHDNVVYTLDGSTIEASPLTPTA